MLKAGGAELKLAGFRRSVESVATLEGAHAFDLGQTQDLKLARRIVAILVALARLPALAQACGQADAILARNLEMLVLGRVLQALQLRSARLAYEVLDIHRLMLGEGVASRTLRSLERRLARKTAVLIVSSPAFFTCYFKRRWKRIAPFCLVENKVLALQGSASRSSRSAEAGPPWKIGWFGMLRCQRSLDLLCRLTKTLGDRVQVVLRGRPTLELFRDFHGQVAGCPGLQFLGPYAPEDLASLYADIHLAWAIDFYEEGQNSQWLLPNRLYESLFMGALPISQRDTETGAWLQRRNAGLLIDDMERELADRMASLTAPVYVQMQAAASAIPVADLVCDVAECESIVRQLAA